MAKVGLKNLHVAIMTPNSDIPNVGVGYGTPKRLIGAIEANINPNSNMGTLFGDDGPMEVATVIGNIELELNVNELSLADQALLLGHEYSNGGIIRRSTDIAPWLAIGFESMKSNGKKRFTWLFKGKFSVPESKNKTKTDNVEFQTQSAKAAFVKRDFDEGYMREVEEDDATYTPEVGANWYKQVDPNADKTPPTVVSTVPANAATGIAVASAIAFTLSKPMDASTITAENILVFKDADGTPVDGVVTINAAKTLVTFTPKANLAASTAYRMAMTKDVKDIFGNRLAAADIRKFTTA